MTPTLFMSALIVFNVILIISILSLFGKNILDKLYIFGDTSEKSDRHFDSAEIDRTLQAPNMDTRGVVINRVKRALNKYTALDQSDIDVTKEYEFDHTKPPHTKFANWASNQDQCVKLFDFGIRLLESNADSQRLLIVTDILKRINDVVSGTHTLGTISALAINRLLKLMVAYEYIAMDEFTKQSICHALITKIVPSLGGTLNEERKPDIVFMGIPRLLTNFLFDPEAYETDLKSTEFKKLDGYFNIKYNATDKIQNGVYMDGSSIETKGTKNIASYMIFQTIAETMRDKFYADAYKALGFNLNSRQIAKAILEKLLHPSIPYHTVGLFGSNSNKITNFNGINFKAHKNGVFVFPLIGIGVFKKPELMFSIRVHKNGVNTPVNNRLILALMQLRKIYVKSETTSDFSKLEDIVDKCGVISEEDNTGLSSDGKEDSEIDSYAISGEKSYIGKLLNASVLFWRNDYTVSKPYQCGICEIGVMTDDGLALAYKMANGKKISKRLVIGTSSDSVIEFTGENRVYEFNKVIGDENKMATGLEFGKDNKTLMKFRYKNDDYEVIPIDGASFIVKRNGEIILGGKSSSNPYDYIYYDNKILRRYSGPMYEPLEM